MYKKVRIKKMEFSKLIKMNDIYLGIGERITSRRRIPRGGSRIF